VSGVSASAGPKYRQVNQEKKSLGLDPKIGCCWVSQFALISGNVGWSAEAEETQQSLASAQPNLRQAMRKGTSGQVNRIVRIMRPSAKNPPAAGEKIPDNPSKTKSIIYEEKILAPIGLLVLVSIGLIFFSSPAPINTPDIVDGKFIRINSQRILYIDSGSGLPLIFIHGFGASIYSWRKNLEPISKHHRVCAPDLPGFGYLDKPLGADNTIDSYADFIIQFMVKLRIKKAVLVVHSLRGGIAFFAGLKYPSRDLPHSISP